MGNILLGYGKNKKDLGATISKIDLALNPSTFSRSMCSKFGTSSKINENNIKKIKIYFFFLIILKRPATILPVCV